MDKLLKLLQENARFSNERLAAMLGITEQEVADKIEEYEKKGSSRAIRSCSTTTKSSRSR